MEKKRYSKKYFVNITGQHRVIFDGNYKGKRENDFLTLSVNRHSVAEHDIFVSVIRRKTAGPVNKE